MTPPDRDDLVDFVAGDPLPFDVAVALQAEGEAWLGRAWRETASPSTQVALLWRLRGADGVLDAGRALVDAVRLRYSGSVRVACAELLEALAAPRRGEPFPPLRHRRAWSEATSLDELLLVTVFNIYAEAMDSSGRLCGALSWAEQCGDPRRYAAAIAAALPLTFAERTRLIAGRGT